MEHSAGHDGLALLLLGAVTSSSPQRLQGSSGRLRKGSKERRVTHRATGKLSIWERESKHRFLGGWCLPLAGTDKAAQQKTPAPRLRAPAPRKPTSGE